MRVRVSFFDFVSFLAAEVKTNPQTTSVRLLMDFKMRPDAFWAEVTA